MNLRRRIERLECQFKKRPRYARAMEELSDTELYEILARGTSLSAEQWAALPDEDFAALLRTEAPSPTSRKPRL